ncbi:Hypothetical predicted protein [Paramuricea clavata]|uniref:Uncharacterized protein n=1 Tax=Paramuricea clavata TaxID=317549 RepID=A0A6S7GRK4_PARCT|nr:Hypothetical predicted protein [Paramuricea clavata]
MIQVASVVEKQGYWKLKDSFCCCMGHKQPCKQPCDSSSQSVQCPAVNNYTSAHAKRKFLRMPLSCITVEVGPKQSVHFLVKDANITLIKSLLGRVYKKSVFGTILSKERVKDLLQLCDGDAQKECLRFGLSEASGLSSKVIKKQFGFSNVIERKIKINNALQKAAEIRECVYQLATIKEQAVLMSLGVELSNSDTDISQSESESDAESATESELGDCRQESSQLLQKFTSD